MRSSITLIAMLLLTALASTPNASATHGPSSCTTTADASAPYVFCTVSCHLGDYLVVSAQGAPGTEVNIYVDCGGATAGCGGIGTCTAISAEAARYDDLGTCTNWGRHAGTCEADILPPISGGSLSSPSHQGGTLSTPPLEACLPADLLCVGPTDPVPLAEVPPVESIELVPAWGVDADYTRRDTQPTIGETPIGPIVVTGPPVPIVICASTCDVPQPGVSNTPGLAVTVTLGSNSQTVTILP